MCCRPHISEPVIHLNLVIFKCSDTFWKSCWISDKYRMYSFFLNAVKCWWWASWLLGRGEIPNITLLCRITLDSSPISSLWMVFMICSISESSLRFFCEFSVLSGIRRTIAKTLVFNANSCLSSWYFRSALSAFIFRSVRRC